MAEPHAAGSHSHIAPRLLATSALLAAVVTIGVLAYRADHMPASDTRVTTSVPALRLKPARVLVLNATRVPLVAKRTRARLVRAFGLAGVRTGNAPARRKTTAVAYANGFRSQGEAIARLLGATPTAFDPAERAGPEGHSDVVVTVGSAPPR